MMAVPPCAGALTYVATPFWEALPEPVRASEYLLLRKLVESRGGTVGAARVERVGAVAVVGIAEHAVAADRVRPRP
jgi:hypothetical protein